VLFTSVDREERYKSKSLIDTAVYRGGDLASSWLQTGLAGLGFGLAGLALLGAPLAVLWGAVGLYIARHQARRPHAPQRRPAGQGRALSLRTSWGSGTPIPFSRSGRCMPCAQRYSGGAPARHRP